MTFYDKSIIYKLKRNDDYDNINIYVGSTSNFKNRKYQHKNCCNNEKNKKYNYSVYQYIRNNGGWENWVMIPIEQYPCNSKKELEIRERYHIDLLRPTLNKVIPTRTGKERYEKNKEQIKEQAKEYWRNNKDKKKEIEKRYKQSHKEEILKKAKQYYESNKEIIAEKNKQYREANKQIIKEWREANKEYFKNYYETNKKIFTENNKKYRDANKEKMAELNKKWREANKEQILEKLKEKAKEKAICDHCGCELRKGNLNRHQKTNKCINFVK